MQPACFAHRRVVSKPYDIEGRHIVIGTSIGIAIAPNDGANPDQLLKNADMALYLAKGDGRGVHRFFEREMDMRLQARRLLELDLRKALENGEFELHYQPIVALKPKRSAVSRLWFDGTILSAARFRRSNLFRLPKKQD